jgi:hypothetical protein
MPLHVRTVASALVVLTLMFAPVPASAQYFGQNKVQYENFDFKILKTQHFDIYYYPVEAEAAKEAGRLAERWYSRLSRMLDHQLTTRQPLILYASHPDFWQTNVVDGVGEGTGGVTESAKRRVTMPFAASMVETDHVLGHELVHAFQYDMLGRAIEGLPLWFIEGMAEYLSLGARDVQTAMWLRDAALMDKLPTIEDLDNPRYFPYRFGHGFWAYIAGRYGDESIGRVLQTLSMPSEQTVARAGDPISAIEAVTQLTEAELSAGWHSAIRETYALETGPDTGQLIGDRTKDGSFSVGPSLSPDGTRVAFLSARDRLSIDLFVADAATGRVIKKVISTTSDPHFDSLQFLASAGAWAPDSKRLAIATLRKSKPVIAIVNAENGDIEREISFETFGEIFQPTWSPDATAIAFSGQIGGYTDLYVHDLASGQTRRLTNDAHADLQPAWSPDGREIAFVTDRFSAETRATTFATYQLATVAAAGGAVAPLPTGLTGDAINPQWGDGGRSVYFISDSEGRRNVYRVDRGTGQSTRVTNEITGVAGITPLSPALSLAASGSKAAFSVFRDSGYEIRVATLQPVGEAVASVRDQGVLPPSNRTATTITQLLRDPSNGLPPPTTTFETEEYKTKLELIDVSNSIGASRSQFGTYAQGGIQMTFSDLLGNHIVRTGVGIDGGVRDFSGSLSYLNRTRRWNWGVFGQHIPVLNGSVQTGLTQENGRTVYVQQTQLIRQTFTETGFLTAYPFSRSARVEFSTSVNRIGFSNELRTQGFDFETGDLLFDERQDLEAPSPLLLSQMSAALVRDTATMGAISPVVGQRLRFEFAPTFGDLRMTNLTADLRHYLMARPVTFAGRLFHFGRYGSDSEDERLQPMYLGYPTLVRGYDINSFNQDDCTPNATSSCPQFDRLVGSRVLVANAEVRAPLASLWTGRLDYGPVPAELFGFFDSGVAWGRGDQFPISRGVGEWVSSAGIGTRVNVFGYLIAEFNVVKPLNRPQRGWMFVFNMLPGF